MNIKKFFTENDLAGCLCGFNHLPPATEFVPRQGCIVLPEDGSRAD